MATEADDLAKFTDALAGAGEGRVAHCDGDIMSVAARIIITHHILTGLAESVINASDVTINGKPYGDFEIIIRRKE